MNAPASEIIQETRGVQTQPKVFPTNEQFTELEDFHYDLVMSAGNLESISELLIQFNGSSSHRFDFDSVGYLLRHHAKSLYDILGKIEEFLCAHREELS